MLRFYTSYSRQKTTSSEGNQDTTIALHHLSGTLLVGRAPCRQRFYGSNTHNTPVRWYEICAHLGDVSEHGKHTDASVLDLHVPEAVKPLLVRVLQPVKRVPESERGLSTEFVLEAHLHRGRGPCPGGQGSTVEGAGTTGSANVDMYDSGK